MDVGIRLSMQDEVSSVATGINQSLESIADSAVGMQDALEPGELLKQYQSLAQEIQRVERELDRADKLAERRAGERGRKDGGGEAQGFGQRSAGTGLLGGISTVSRGAGRAASTLGATGDAGAAVEGVMGTIGGLAQAIPVIGRVALAVGSVAFAMNALARQYKQHMDTVIEVNSILGRFGKTATETSENFRDTMNQVSDDAQRYGYDLQTGMGVYQALVARAGTATSEDAREVMYFQRFGGFDPSTTARYQGLGMRFDQGGEGLLERALGATVAGGAPRGLLGEFLEGASEIFEGGISRGVVKGFEDINVMQAWLGKLGPAYQGQYGVGLYRRMEEAAVGATALESEADAIMYRAGRRMLEAGGKPVDYQSVMMELEKGMTPELLGYYLKALEEMTGGVRADMRELMKEGGVAGTYTEAETILAGRGGLETAAAPWMEPGRNVRGTAEVQLLRAEATIQKTIRNLGRLALGPLSTILADTVGPAAEKLGDWLDERFKGIIDKSEWKTIESRIFTLEETEERAKGMMTDPTAKQRPNPYLEYAGLIKKSIRSGREYEEFPEIEESGRQLASLINSIQGSPEALKALQETGVFFKAQQEAYDVRSPGEGRRRGFTPNDLPLVLERILEMIERVNATFSKDLQLTIDLNNFIE